MQLNPIAAVFISLMLGPGVALSASLQFAEGIARNPQSAVELYREQHWIRSEGRRTLERLVLYRCPDGTAFGRKRLDYRMSATSPSFTLDDRRSGYREGVRPGRRATLFFRPDGKSLEQSAALDPTDVVVDAGFDEFVRARWDDLVAGRTVALAFAVPSRLRSMAFSVSRVGEASGAGEKAWLFRLKLASWLRWIAPSIDVSYGQVSQRLLRFEGLSNLRDDAGDKPVLARIDFDQRAKTVDEAQWRTALDTPLSNCRIGR